MATTTQHTTHDTANFPAVARDLQHIEHDRAALFEEYRRLLLLPDADVTDDDRTRFSEIVSILNLSIDQITRDAAIVSKVRSLEKQVAAGAKWEAKQTEIQAKIDALKTRDSPAYDKLLGELRQAESRAAIASRRKIDLGFAMRGTKRAAELFGQTPLHDDSARPLQSGAVRLG
jgi:hypothetical protein